MALAVGLEDLRPVLREKGPAELTEYVRGEILDVRPTELGEREMASETVSLVRR